MAWIYAPAAALVARRSQTSAKRSATSKITNTAKDFFATECKPDILMKPQFGTISKHSKEVSGLASWISYLVESRASHTPPQEICLESQINENFPITSVNLWKTYDQESRCWKMSQITSIRGSRTPLVKWPNSGIAVNGMCYQLIRKEPRIYAKDSGLSVIQSEILKDYLNYKLTSLEAMKKLNTGKRPLCLFQTPNCRDAHNVAGKAQLKRTSPSMSTILGGRVNPEFQEWLMGLPLGWTDLNVLEMPGFLKWQQSLASE